jgi:hypothetical protein
LAERTYTGSDVYYRFVSSKTALILLEL